MDEGHGQLVEECFGQAPRKKPEAQRKRQRRDEDDEYSNDADERQPRPHTRAGSRSGGNEVDQGTQQQEHLQLRRSRRLRGQKVESD